MFSKYSDQGDKSDLSKLSKKLSSRKEAKKEEARNQEEEGNVKNESRTRSFATNKPSFSSGNSFGTPKDLKMGSKKKSEAVDPVLKEEAFEELWNQMSEEGKLDSIKAFVFVKSLHEALALPFEGDEELKFGFF